MKQTNSEKMTLTKVIFSLSSFYSWAGCTFQVFLFGGDLVNKIKHLFRNIFLFGTKSNLSFVYILSSLVLVVTTRKSTKKRTGQNAKYCGCLSWVPPKARKKKHENKHEKERKNARKKAR